jgi:hypothetical protein
MAGSILFSGQQGVHNNLFRLVITRIVLGLSASLETLPIPGLDEV